ncbi:hypothetical protein KGA66_13580 [Actinocrinis puniceicyclus]|uniref:OmpR/PhoB-type domain-containing protein n=1 Tax=Actinocrinis puniceicyclus TaxID=977794 RepID=A0A8J7WMK9_9ACTN|nr:BTAD domain-containing putative transcriptional regulator [Actinocrinis puniceicyclus]MBS2964083.1 hypothetical protein [Actinocrinis puniceicyclus]
MADLEFRVLGPVELLSGGQPVPMGASTAVTLLAGLLLSADDVVSADRLGEIVWARRQPARPRAALHSAISRLRRLLGPDVLESLPGGYRLNARAARFDLSLSDQLADTAAAARARGALDEAADALQEALGLWRGRPLGNVDSPVLADEAARLAEKHLALQEERAELFLRTGRHALLVEVLPALVRAEPFRERLVGQLMLALSRSGRQVEALAAYESLDSALREGLGIGPSAWLRDLHLRILRPESVPESVLGPGPGLGPVPGPGPELGPVPGRRPALEAQTQSARRHADCAALTTWRGLRPPSQRLIDRGEQIDGLARAVLDQRVVTLVGAAGVGKTAVALNAASRVAPGFPDGVTVVELGYLPPMEPRRPATDEGYARIVAAVCAALEVRGPGQPAAALKETQSLLVLDNAEHVAADCGRFVDQITRSCPGIRILTTSRRPLGLGGEAVVELPPLEPASAARLLRLRASGHLPRLDLSTDPEAVAELCRAVEGLPLAVELAAARLRTMSLRTLLRRVGWQRGLLVAPNGAGLPHQRGLDSTLEWSYDLLTRPAQRLLGALAAFDGPFTLEEAERAVACTPPTWQEVAGLLGGLVDHSLVQTQRHGERYSYRLLTPVRRFVLGRTARCGAGVLTELWQGNGSAA